MRRVKYHIAMLFVSVSFYLVACVTTGLRFHSTNPREPHWTGAQLLLIGWMGIAFGQLAWCANPIAFLSWAFLILKLRQPAFGMGIAAMVLSLNTLTLYFWYPSGDTADFRFEGLGPGFYAWFISILAACVGAYALPRSSQGKQW